MARPSRKQNPAPHGRPVKKVDWDLVDELCKAGCPGTEIAPHFGMHPHTFYDKVLAEKGVLFTDYQIEKRSIGEANIRYTQYKKAIGETDKGDNVMLVWLGKNRLNQRETSEVSISGDITKAFVGVMEQISAVHLEKTKPAESPKITAEQKQSFKSEFN